MLTGTSYGGYVTLAAAIAYGDRIRCAFEGFGLSDFVAFLDGTDPSRRRDRLAEYGDPADPAMRDVPQEHLAADQRGQAQGSAVHRPGRQGHAGAARPGRGDGTGRPRQRQPVWYVVYDAGHEEFTQATNDFYQYAWVLFVQKYLLELTKSLPAEDAELADSQSSLWLSVLRRVSAVKSFVQVPELVAPAASAPGRLILPPLG